MKNRVHQTMSGDNDSLDYDGALTSRQAALTRIRKALSEERYEELQALIAVAKEAGVGKREIQLALAGC